MIDPGHPFSMPFKDLIDSLEESIREGVEQPTQDRFIFRSNQIHYSQRRKRIYGRDTYGIYNQTSDRSIKFTIQIRGKYVG